MLRMPCEGPPPQLGAGKLARRVIAVNRRAGRVRLDDGLELPIVEAMDRTGRPTSDYATAIAGVAEDRSTTPPIGYFVHFGSFRADAAS